jgi:serine/threonine protein kinase
VPRTDEVIPSLEQHRDFFRKILQRVHVIMAENYDMHKVSIKPMGGGGSRLSIPIRIDGYNSKGQQVHLFAKILGNSEIMTERTIQFFKNMYLHMSNKPPLFMFTSSAEQMAKHQFSMMLAIYNLGIPTAKPYGYHPLKGNLWLLVAEYLEASSIATVRKIADEHLNTAFKNLHYMHKKGIYHGDLKPDNILISDKVYFMDVGAFLDEAPGEDKLAYDLASQIVSFLGNRKPEEIVVIARRHYPKKNLRNAATYIELVQRRPDFNVSDEVKEKLMRLLSE